MANKLKTIDGEEGTTNLLVDESGNEIINLNEDSGYEISEAFEEEGGFFSALYTDYSGSEMIVLFDNKGKEIFNSIIEINEFISSREEFILIIDGTKNEKVDDPYLNQIDYLWCVINKRGEFISEPQKDSIQYSEEENKYILD